MQIVIIFWLDECWKGFLASLFFFLFGRLQKKTKLEVSYQNKTLEIWNSTILYKPYSYFYKYVDIIVKECFAIHR